MVLSDSPRPVAESLAPPLLARGDALQVCRKLPAELRFDLVYLDPPYGLGTTMTARLGRGQSRGRRTAQSGPDAYVDPAGPEELLELLLPRLEALRERMAPGASLWLHLDHRAVHEAKVAVDRLFGRGAFLGEVIWTPGNGSRGARGFAVTHQTLLRWARSPEDRARTVWNADDPDLREPFAETSLAMHFRQVDGEGRRYRERHVGGKTYRYYADEGRRLGSVWTDLPAMRANTPLHREGTGYPTQKPLRLLERIVRASSHPDAVVADLMCGSGTTLVAAASLGRRFVGGDASPVALELTRTRLKQAGLSFAELDAENPAPP